MVGVGRIGDDTVLDGFRSEVGGKGERGNSCTEPTRLSVVKEADEDTGRGPRSLGYGSWTESVRDEMVGLGGSSPPGDAESTSSARRNIRSM